MAKSSISDLSSRALHFPHIAMSRQEKSNSQTAQRIAITGEGWKWREDGTGKKKKNMSIGGSLSQIHHPAQKDVTTALIVRKY